MGNPEVFTIAKGTMINFSNHEDDDALIAEKPLLAIPLGPAEHGGIPVRIPSLDPERTYFIHQPEKRASE